MMNDSNKSKLIDIAIMNGCKTVKDFALFLKEYAPKIEDKIVEKMIPEKEISQLSLLR